MSECAFPFEGNGNHLCIVEKGFPFRLNVPSRLKGMETLCYLYIAYPVKQRLNVPSRLKGMETLKSDPERVKKSGSECAFPFEGNGNILPWLWAGWRRQYLFGYTFPFEGNGNDKTIYTSLIPPVFGYTFPFEGN